MSKKVLVSGCFDMLHSGHVAFFEEASKYGDLYVVIGSDRNVFELKHRPTINTEDERLYMIKSLRCVKEVMVAQGSGILDFVIELQQIQPDYFVVNEDGSTPAKKTLCAELGIEYIVLKREPHKGLTPRSTTALRGTSLIPESLTLAGSDLDQPPISRLAAGAVLVLSIYPLNTYSSGLRSSAIELWNARLPADLPEKMAKVLFGYSNLPGTKSLRSATEAIGITHPGLTRAEYSGNYWPQRISSLQCENTLSFIEKYLYMVAYDPQPTVPTASRSKSLSHELARLHAQAAENCWNAILEHNAPALGKAMSDDYQARQSLYPFTPPAELLEHFQGKVLGFNTCSLGERAALLLIANQPLEDAVRITIIGQDH